MTDDPLENSWLTPQEKEMVAVSQKRQVVAQDASSSKFDYYRRQMKFKNKQKGKKQPPWKKIFCTRMLWVATLQATAQAWSGIMMILMAKEYLEEVHGYSLQEAAIAVTIPNNLAQFLLGLCVGYLGDWLIKMRVSEVAVRRVGAAVQILAILPLLVLPFLPCSAITYGATMWAVQVTPPLCSVLLQVICSLRVFGNLAGYSSYRHISPTFQRHLFGLSSIASLSLPGILVPAIMAAMGTTKHDQ